jgi:hypothetical protein
MRRICHGLRVLCLIPSVGVSATHMTPHASLLERKPRVRWPGEMRACVRVISPKKAEDCRPLES